MKTTKERLQQSANDLIKRAQNHAVSMYNMENWCQLIDDVRDMVGIDHVFSINDNWWGTRGVVISYSLQKDEGFKGQKVGEILGFLLDTDFNLIREDEYEEGQWKEWKFTYTDTPQSFAITMRFYYGESEKCKMVHTGEFEAVPVKELVCE